MKIHYAVIAFAKMQVFPLDFNLIAWINSYVPKKNITAQEQITKMVKTLSNRL